MTSRDPTVSPDELHGLIVDALGAVGVPRPTGQQVATLLVEADLRGVASHGAHLVPLYVSRIAEGLISPAAEAVVSADDGSTVCLDARLGLGQIAGLQATDLLVERARAHGAATVAVREATHLGALGAYTRRAAEQGVIALCFQNGPTIVAPFGGVTPLLSTNPVSYAVPTGDEPTLVYDVATTAVAGNKVLLAQRRGDTAIPAGWANDASGQPTTDTAAASVHHLQWFGGHKGFGLALLVELLAGVLAGSSFGHTEHTASPAHGPARVAKGFVLVGIDPQRFIGLAEFRRRTDALIADVRASPPAAGVERVLVPGQLEHETERRRRVEGIPVPATLLDELRALAARTDQ